MNVVIAQWDRIDEKKGSAVEYFHDVIHKIDKIGRIVGHADGLKRQQIKNNGEDLHGDEPESDRMQV